MFLSHVFIAQGCGDSDPCGDGGHYRLCGIRIQSFGTLFVSAPLCGDSDLCDPDRKQSAVVGCFERTPLCEDCDLCDQKQRTANIAALRVLYHVWSVSYTHLTLPTIYSV